MARERGLVALDHCVDGDEAVPSRGDPHLNAAAVCEVTRNGPVFSLVEVPCRNRVLNIAQSVDPLREPITQVRCWQRRRSKPWVRGQALAIRAGDDDVNHVASISYGVRLSIKCLRTTSLQSRMLMQFW